MRTRIQPTPVFLAVAAVAGAGLLPASGKAASIGFNQTTAGPWDYNTSSNWADINADTVGDINGIWDSSLTVSAAQTVTFGADTTLTTGLRFLYDGSNNVTLRSSGVADRTLTLGGDVVVSTVASSRTVTFGNTTNNQRLNVDLGGAVRSLSVGSGLSLTFANNVSNGGLLLSGTGTVNMNSANTLSALTLKGVAWAHSNAAGDTDISGALTIDGAAGGANLITMSSAGTTRPGITAGSLSRANGGAVFFRGATLGTGAPLTNNINNITFATAPALVGGGGGAGSQNISIIPWAAGDTSTSGGGSGATTFVTYHDTNGIRLLTASEFDSTITDGASTTNNVQVVNGTTTTINSDTTINSLITASGATATVLNGTGTLNITSGAVFLGTGNGQPNLGVTVNFGTRQGVIGTGAGKGGTVSGAIQGSGGLMVYQANTRPVLGSGGSSLTYNGNAVNSTYTGDTYIVGKATMLNGVLPSGARTGDVYVSGILETNGVTINGLNGSGLITKPNSGTGTLSIGDNTANGDFSGAINNPSGTYNLIKTGTGTQILSGANAYTGTTTVSAGKLLINGSIANGTVTVSNTATLGGSGSIGGSVIVNSGGTLAPGNSIGTLATGALNLGSGTFAVELNTTLPAADRVNVTGNLSLADAVLTLTDLGSNSTLALDQVFTLISYSGTWNNGLFAYGAGTLGNGDTFTFGANQYRIDYDDGGNAVTLTVVPEPATLSLLGASVLGLLRRRRATSVAQTRE